VSTVNKTGSKVELPCSARDLFWQRIHDYYAGEDQRKWKYLAMLALRENAGWQLDHIGKAFDHRKGHVTRCLRKIKQDIRTQFRVSPDYLSRTGPDDED